MDGWTDVRTNGRMENLPILQDFVPYRGRCPKRSGSEKPKPESHGKRAKDRNLKQEPGPGSYGSWPRSLGQDVWQGVLGQKAWGRVPGPGGLGQEAWGRFTGAGPGGLGHRAWAVYMATSQKGKKGWLGLRPDWLGLRPGCMAHRGGCTDGRMNGKSPHSTGLCPLSTFEKLLKNF